MSPQGSPPGTDCPECHRLRRELDAALARIAVLEAQVKDLLERLQRNSSNSSTPPSANPLNAPKPVGKPPTGRPRGGQKGHRGHHRTRLPKTRVNEVVIHLPKTCDGCHEPLPSEPGRDDHESGWHQVAELPVMAAIVTEHQAHTRTCSMCGLINQGTIPARYHLSKRDVKELVEAVFDVPVSLGTVVAKSATRRSKMPTKLGGIGDS